MSSSSLQAILKEYSEEYLKELEEIKKEATQGAAASTQSINQTHVRGEGK